MKYWNALYIFAIVFLQFFAFATATVLPGSAGAVLLPSSPTSADNLRVSLPQTCHDSGFKGNPYSVNMAQNNISVSLGERVGGISPATCPPIVFQLEIELGRLPPGNYTVTVIEGPTGYVPGTLIDRAPFTVSDARATKSAPYVRLDYSGHWWDPNDSGWGLFIWHDTRSNVDNMLAAWFTYTADGKPMWYVFQPRWQTGTSTFTADLAQASRPPGASSPPPTTTSASLAGTSSLDFTNNVGTNDPGRLTYTFTGGPTLTRNIQRFKP